MSEIITIKQLGKTFRMHEMNKELQAISEIDLQLRSGEFVGITGKSGSGKSTVLKCIYRTYLPSTGQIRYRSLRFGDIDLGQVSERHMMYLRKHEIGYVSQFLTAMPRTTARELVEQASREMGYAETDARRQAEQMLSHFELDQNLWDSYPQTFSGGEKLRVNIARAMVKRPNLLLLDEPTASLDNESKQKVYQLLMQMKQQGTTMLGIFHDIEFMNHLCDREYRMKNGRLIEHALS
jgi:alpha-D-ribose 1-methylphosphonate 5-triphosphate synthase subunit PhnL